MLGFIFPDVWATRARNTIYIYIFRIHMFIAKYGVYARSITLALRSRCQLPIFSGILGNVALIIYIYITCIARKTIYLYRVPLFSVGNYITKRHKLNLWVLYMWVSSAALRDQRRFHAMYRLGWMRENVAYAAGDVAFFGYSIYIYTCT